MEKPVNPYKRVGEAIAQVRESLGLSQAEFGEIVHASQSSVSRWENGLAAPDVVQARAIEQRTGKSLRVF